jgi:7,8-dihydropterin-6-yl-methyl-4-(beta-D-ribofuranosyl)aminobenzene 5'-phosphate synthase
MSEATPPSKHLPLKPVQRIQVTTLLDNYVDLMLEDTAIVKRPPLSSTNELPTDTLIAEHGLSLLVETTDGSQEHTILFDAGYNAHSVGHNMDLLATDIQAIEAVVLSHAHMDHCGALVPILQKIGRAVPLIVHPAAFEFPRILTMKTGRQVTFPETLSREELASLTVMLIESRSPTSIAGGTVTVTGQVKRTTAFEKGMPNASVQRDGRLEHDSILDDQSLVLHLENKGLVLVTGCCHAGVINTLHYAKKVTGIQEVYAILGGLHLTGSFFDPVIGPTIKALQAIDPKVIVPMHCTGWRATQKISEAFPEAFILNSVGSAFVLE